MGRALQGIKTAMVFLKTLVIPCGYCVGTHQVSQGKGNQHRQAFLKITLETLAQIFMFSSGVRFGRSLS
jgi:hypothetical protein